MSVLTDLIYGGSNVVAGLTEVPSMLPSKSMVPIIPLRSPTLHTSSPPFTQPPASRSRPWAIWFPAWAC